MSERRIGDWCQTASGVAFYPLDPRVEDIKIYDIAHALSMQCRFNGHCVKFYSVAEHCVRVSDAVSREHAPWALLHDATEAYLVDLPRPLKHYSELGNQFQLVENKLARCICERFGLPLIEPPEVKKVDQILLMTEQRDLMVSPPAAWSWGIIEKPFVYPIIPWSQEMAKAQFLQRFNNLFNSSLW